MWTDRKLCSGLKGVGDGERGRAVAEDPAVNEGHCQCGSGTKVTKLEPGTEGQRTVPPPVLDPPELRPRVMS